MENDKRNQLIVVGIILMLFIIVILFIAYSIINGKSDNDKKSNIKIQQIYSSDYKIKMFNDNFFIGSYEDNKINVIIDANGIEIYKESFDVLYDNMYMMEDGKTLFYNHINNEVNMYIFDGDNFKFYYTISDVPYVKPVIYVKDTQKFIIGFASIVDDNLHLFNIATKSSVVLDKKSIVGDAISNDSYYVFNNKYIVVKSIEGMMGVVDIDGKLIIDYEYKNILGTCNDSFIVLSKKDKYGIINNKNEMILKFNYKAISAYKDYYLIVDSKNKMALFDSNINDLTGFKMNYDDLVDFDLRNSTNSINLEVVSDKIIVLNNYQELRNGTEYDKHNMYVIEDGKIVDNILQKEFVIDEIIYLIDKDNNLKILDKDLTEMFNMKLEENVKMDNVRYVKDDVIEVSLKIGELIENFYYNNNGEKIDFDIGNLEMKNDSLSIFTKKIDNLITIFIYDKNNSLIDQKEGEYFEVNDNFIIVDNNIYKIVIS